MYCLLIGQSFALLGQLLSSGQINFEARERRRYVVALRIVYESLRSVPREPVVEVVLVAFVPFLRPASLFNALLYFVFKLGLAELFVGFNILKDLHVRDDGCLLLALRFLSEGVLVQDLHAL